MIRTLRAGTRPSRLAVRQAEEIARALPFVSFEVVTIETAGDRDKKTPLSAGVREDFWTAEIEEALLNGSIDLGVHSAKDLEANVPCGLMTAVITPSLSPFECLVSRGNVSLANLPRNAVVGTSGARRKEAVIRFRPDLVPKDLRGDIDERLKQLDEGKFDAIIVAHAALIRLGYEERIAEIIPREIMEPHPLQGRLAVQVRRERADLITLLSKLTHLSFPRKRESRRG